MKATEMINMRDARENAIGFLHISDIQRIYTMTGFDVSNKSFYDVFDVLYLEYARGKLNNKEVSEGMEMIMNANTNFKIEKFRDTGYGEILKYDEDVKGYLHYQQGGEKILKYLNRTQGKYID